MCCVSLKAVAVSAFRISVVVSPFALPSSNYSEKKKDRERERGTLEWRMREEKHAFRVNISHKPLQNGF